MLKNYTELKEENFDKLQRNIKEIELMLKALIRSLKNRHRNS